MDKLVTAVVPTIGESTLKESIAHLQNQSVALADIVVIHNVTAFPAAMNRGVEQVKTQFLLQCDADMLLHPDCVETLLAAMDDSAGIAIGYLHDELLGDIQAVKLYRTKCLRQEPFADSVASDTDGAARIVRRGFQVRFVSRERTYRGHAADVLGLHKPNYEDPLFRRQFQAQSFRHYKAGGL